MKVVKGKLLELDCLHAVVVSLHYIFSKNWNVYNISNQILQQQQLNNLYRYLYGKVFARLVLTELISLYKLKKYMLSGMQLAQNECRVKYANKIMTGEGLFVFSLKTKSVMPFFAIFPAETSSQYYEYIKITTLGANYTSQKVYIYTRVREYRTVSKIWSLNLHGIV